MLPPTRSRQTAKQFREPAAAQPRIRCGLVQGLLPVKIMGQSGNIIRHPQLAGPGARRNQGGDHDLGSTPLGQLER